MFNRLSITLGALLLLALPLSACEIDDTKAGKPIAQKTTDAPATNPEADSTYEPPPAAEPDGTFTSNCDYILGDFTNYTKSGFRFVADAKLHNTGNVGTIDEVKAIWYQAGGGKIVETKKVRSRPGQTVRVGITKPVGQDQIDLIQSLDYGDECKVKVTMIDTFGTPE